MTDRNWITDPLEHWPDVSQDNIIDSMGSIPSFLPLSDVPAKEQIDLHYAAYGGWKPLPGWIMDIRGVIQFPGDRELTPAALLVMDNGEQVRFYPGAWVSIRQPDGILETSNTYEVARLD